MNGFCSKCGAELNGEYCSKCGKKQESNLVSRRNIDPESYAKQQKKNRGCLWVVLGMVILFVGIFVLGIMNAPETDNSMEGKIATAFGVDEVSATESADILKRIEIEELESIEHDELLDHDGLKGYRAVADGSKIIIYTSEAGTIEDIKYVDKYLYRGGKVRSKLNYFVPTDEEIAKVQTVSMDVVKGILKSPTSATFPSVLDWKFSKDRKGGKEIFIAQSYVDAQNGLGAMIRSEFTITYEDTIPVSIIFDGKEMLK